jgi:hypothetical protein
MLMKTSRILSNCSGSDVKKSRSTPTVKAGDRARRNFVGSYLAGERRLELLLLNFHVDMWLLRAVLGLSLAFETDHQPVLRPILSNVNEERRFIFCEIVQPRIVHSALVVTNRPGCALCLFVY